MGIRYLTDKEVVQGINSANSLTEILSTLEQFMFTLGYTDIERAIRHAISKQSHKGEMADNRPS